jgi:hypothetical protein
MEKKELSDPGRVNVAFEPALLKNDGSMVNAITMRAEVV